MFKRSLSSGAALAAFALAAGPALAADMPRGPAPAAPSAFAPAPAFYNWSGAYVGLQGGYGWGKRHARVPAFPPAGRKFSYDSSGWLFGATAGVNAQFDQIVVGIEGDLAWAGLDGRLSLPGGALPGGLTGASESHDMKWLGTLRARAGFALDTILLYGTGGFAFAKIDGHAAFRPGGGPTFVAKDSNTHTGWTLGAGIEASLTDSLSVKTEYLYVDLNKKNYGYAFAPGGPTTVVSADHHSHIVRAGVNWRFGGM